MSVALEDLAPHKSVFGVNAVHKVSKNLSFPKTVISTIANFLDGDTPPPDPVKLAAMQKAFA